MINRLSQPWKIRVVRRGKSSWSVIVQTSEPRHVGLDLNALTGEVVLGGEGGEAFTLALGQSADIDIDTTLPPGTPSTAL